MIGIGFSCRVAVVSTMSLTLIMWGPPSHDDALVRPDSIILSSTAEFTQTVPADDPLENIPGNFTYYSSPQGAYETFTFGTSAEPYEVGVSDPLALPIEKDEFQLWEVQMQNPSPTAGAMLAEYFAKTIIAFEAELQRIFFHDVGPGPTIDVEYPSGIPLQPFVDPFEDAYLSDVGGTLLT